MPLKKTSQNQEDNLLILEARKLKKVYNQKEVVKNVGFRIIQGQIVGLLGPNGAGKTTSFYMTVGLIKPTNGRIYLGKEEITKLPIHKRAQLGLGYLAQEASIFRKLTVKDNILSILEIKHRKSLPQEKINEKLQELLEQFEIKHVANQYGYTLSGGERRRTEIARTLATEPKFLLLDEPFAGVDPIAVKDIQKVITFLKKKKLGILITDHNVRETLKITDKSYIIFEGQILMHGTAKQIIRSKLAKEKYLGEDFKI